MKNPKSSISNFYPFTTINISEKSGFATKAQIFKKLYMKTGIANCYAEEQLFFTQCYALMFNVLLIQSVKTF